MRRTWKQLWCAHWWSEPTKQVYGHSAGPIICTEQKTWEITVETRDCRKCGLTDDIEIDRKFLGWE